MLEETDPNRASAEPGTNADAAPTAPVGTCWVLSQILWYFFSGRRVGFQTNPQQTQPRERTATLPASDFKQFFNVTRGEKALKHDRAPKQFGVLLIPPVFKADSCLQLPDSLPRNVFLQNSKTSALGQLKKTLHS